MRILVTLTAALLVALLPPEVSARPERAPRRILLFTRAQGFEHSTVVTGKDAEPFALGVLSALGTGNGWQVVHSKDGGLFTTEFLAGFDAYFLLTTGDLTALKLQDKRPLPADDVNQKPMTAEGKAALLAAVASGKGLIAVHNGSDTFHSPGPRWEEQPPADVDGYVAALGGEFIAHGDQQKARVRVIDKRFPGFDRIGDGFELFEEWYSFKNQAPDLHALLVIESGPMIGAAYARPPYPVAWARRQGKGRVFYSALGHREDVWTNPLFQKMLTGGIRFALGDAPADVAPNVTKAAPGYKTLPKKIAGDRKSVTGETPP